MLIYNVGDIYYQLCFDRISTTNKNNHLSVEDVVGTIVVNETNFNVSWIYNIDLAKSKLEIFTNVQNFNSSNKSHALICTGLYSFGLIKENDDLYFFDSHSRSPRGKSAVNGKACIIKFTGESKIDNITNHICKFIDVDNITVEINQIVCLKLTNTNQIKETLK